MPSCHMSPISNIWEHPAERWRYEYISEREDTVWMEHLEEDVRGPMRREDIRKMIAQPAIGLLYGVDTVSMASSDAKKRK